MKNSWFLSAAVPVILVLALAAQPALAYEAKVAEISKYLSDEIAKTNKKLVAVVDFTDLQGNVTELGRFFAQEISTSIAMEGKTFEVVDRTHLNTILTEHKLAEKGIINPETARQLGKIAGVEILVTGTITPMGDYLRLNAMVLDIETAKIIAAAKDNIPMTSTLATLSGAEIKTVPSSKEGNSSSSEEASETTASGTEVENFGFKIKAMGCEMKSSDLICPIAFTSLESDKRRIIIAGGGRSGGSTFHDESGNVYRYRDIGVSFGEKAKKSLIFDFMPQVPTMINFIVKGFNRDSAVVTASIFMSEAGSKNFSTSVIKDIPIIK